MQGKIAFILQLIAAHSIQVGRNRHPTLISYPRMYRFICNNKRGISLDLMKIGKAKKEPVRTYYLTSIKTQVELGLFSFV